MNRDQLLEPDVIEAAGKAMFSQRRPCSGDLLRTPWAMLMPETRNTLRAMLVVGLGAAWDEAQRKAQPPEATE
jgi:hypothetical protein